MNNLQAVISTVKNLCRVPLLVSVVLLLCACNSETSSNGKSTGSNPESEQPVASANADAAASAAGGYVELSMEGATHRLDKINWTDSKVTFEDEQIGFYLTDDESPIKFNLSLAKTDILQTGSATYVLPASNSSTIKVDINFFNEDRPGTRMKKRIIFSEGTIEVKQLTDHSLKMTFSGAGHALMEKAKFPIEGTVDLSF